MNIHSADVHIYGTDAHIHSADVHVYSADAHIHAPLGIIGGMGPYASAHFYKRLLELQHEFLPVENEQDYIDIILYSKPSIPDRSAFIKDAAAENPFPAILGAGRVLENAGCAMIAIPCVTAHFFYDRLCESLNIPVLNTVYETALYAKEKGVKKAGLLTTDGTIKGRMFHNELSGQGIETVTLPSKSQECLMQWIYQKAKQGGKPETETLARLSGELFALGAETVILGCTELSLSDPDWRARHIDALDVLACASLREMKAHLN